MNRKSFFKKQTPLKYVISSTVCYLFNNAFELGKMCTRLSIIECHNWGVVLFYFYLCLYCVHLCICADMCPKYQRTIRVSEPSKTGITGGRELFSFSARNRKSVLWKNSKLSEPVSHSSRCECHDFHVLFFFFAVLFLMAYFNKFYILLPRLPWNFRQSHRLTQPWLKIQTCVTITSLYSFLPSAAQWKMFLTVSV